MKTNPNDHAPPDQIGHLNAELHATRAVLSDVLDAHDRWRHTGEADDMIAAGRRLHDAAERGKRLLATPGSAEQWIERHVEA